MVTQITDAESVVALFTEKEQCEPATQYASYWLGKCLFSMLIHYIH